MWPGGRSATLGTHSVPPSRLNKRLPNSYGQVRQESASCPSLILFPYDSTPWATWCIGFSWFPSRPGFLRSDTGLAPHNSLVVSQAGTRSCPEAQMVLSVVHVDPPSQMQRPRLVLAQVVHLGTAPNWGERCSVELAKRSDTET